MYCSVFHHSGTQKRRICIYSYDEQPDKDGIECSEKLKRFNEIAKTKKPGESPNWSRICSTITNGKVVDDWELDNGMVVTQHIPLFGNTTWNVGYGETVMTARRIFHPIKFLQGVSSFIDIEEKIDYTPHLLAVAIVSSPYIRDISVPVLSRR